MNSRSFAAAPVRLRGRMALVVGSRQVEAAKLHTIQADGCHISQESTARRVASPVQSREVRRVSSQPFTFAKLEICPSLISHMQIRFEPIHWPVCRGLPMVARLSRPTFCAAHLPAANAHSVRIPTAHERIAAGPFDEFPGHFDKSEILPEADPDESGSLQQQLVQQLDPGGLGRILLLEPGEGDREVLSQAARLLHPSIKSLIHNGLVQVSEWR